jgi:hypothetical protein
VGPFVQKSEGSPSLVPEKDKRPAANPEGRAAEDFWVTIYISGPITGLPDLNKPAVRPCGRELRSSGHAVINPHEIGEPSEDLLPWESYLRADLIAMLQHADGLAMLPGWEAAGVLAAGAARCRPPSDGR